MSDSRATNILPLRLVPVAGPAIEPAEVPADRASVLGRSAECTHCLPDPSVSRRHAEIVRRAGRWLLTDLGSRGGTYVNSLRVAPDSPTPLATGDEIRIHPWTFRVQVGSAEGAGPMTMSLRTQDDSGGQGRYVETFTGAELQGLGQQRLDLLLDYASEINSAQDESELAAAVVRSALSGSGLARAALIRTIGGGEEVEVLGSQTAEGIAAGTFSFSRSLIREAEGGRVARLGGQLAGDGMHSIVAMGIHSALCAPVIVDGSVVACLYLDARGAESRVRADAMDFCVALARLSGLAFGNIQRRRMHDRQREMEEELGAARRVQELLVPQSGEAAGVRFRVHVQPGQFVAGDLFDVVPLRDGRVAVCIGDVTGHGAGAGILMAAAQAFLNSALLGEGDPARAVAATSRYIVRHARVGKFASLWVGVFDKASSKVTIVDAGHGHCLLVDGGRAARRLDAAGGQMLGVDADGSYESVTIDLPPGSRLLLFSDGIIEQPGPGGARFGMDRLIQGLKDPGTDDPKRIIHAVEAFAGTKRLDDDATAAWVGW